MSLKTILDIEVQDGAFKAFAKVFADYRKQVGDSSAEWTRLNAKIIASKDAFQKMVDLEKLRVVQSRINVEVGKAAVFQLDRQGAIWKRIAASSKEVADNVGTATRMMLQWGRAGGVIAGLLGGGGLFGIDALAASAAGRRRSASGLGLTTGQQSAFQLNYGRVVNADSMLSGVNEALTDQSKKGPLYTAGLSERDIAGKDAAQVSIALIGRLKDLVDKTETKNLGFLQGAYKLGALGISEEDLRRIKDRSRGELSGYGAAYNASEKSLSLGDKTGEAWETFNIKLREAGLKIETVLTKGLTPLLEPLTKMTTALVDFATSILSSPEFPKQVEAFIDGVVKMARIMGHIIGFFPGSWSAAPGTLAGPRTDKLPQTNQEKLFDQEREKFLEGNEKVEKFYKSLRDGISDGIKGALGGFELGPSNLFGVKANGAQSFQGMVHQAAYNPANSNSSADSPEFKQRLLDAVWGAESNYGRNKGPSRSGAQGDFQFMPGTWKDWGNGGDINNYGDSRNAADRYLGHLLKMFNGDLDKALAGYNAGPGNVNRAVDKYGPNWLQHLPDETQKYVGKVEVNIFNNTGGNANVSTSALPGARAYAGGNT